MLLLQITNYHNSIYLSGKKNRHWKKMQLHL